MNYYQEKLDKLAELLKYREGIKEELGTLSSDKVGLYVNKVELKSYVSRHTENVFTNCLSEDYKEQLKSAIRNVFEYQLMKLEEQIDELLEDINNEG